MALLRKLHSDLTGGGFACIACFNDTLTSTMWNKVTKKGRRTFLFYTLFKIVKR